MLKKPQFFLQLTITLLIGIYAFSLFTYPVYSDEATDIENQIDEITNELTEKKTVLATIEDKIAEISSSNYSVSKKLSLINNEISSLDKQIEENETALKAKVLEIADKQEAIAEKKLQVDEISSDLYMQSRYGLITFFLSGSSWDDMVKQFLVKTNAISLLKADIEKTYGEFNSLEDSKALLESEKTELDAQKADMDDAYDLLAAEKASLQSQLNSQYSQKTKVTKQIGSITKELSDLQNFLLIVKSGGTVVDAGDLSSTSSTGSLAYFDANAPSGSFAVFSFGAFTHRNGMSQWGAKARDDAGQSYKEILAAYYPTKFISTGTLKTTTYGSEDITETIIVDGKTVNLEDNYMLGIREIDGSWNKTSDLNVLKAQAIASRTYAINYTQNGRKSICSTQSCQVYSSSNPYSTSSAWAQAVRETAGMVLTSSTGYVFSAQFSAVTGGWINNVGYDVKSGTGSWIGRAWENISGVTWFYRTWYDYNTNTGSYGACSTHPNPWLTNTEMADILNAYKYWVQAGSPDNDPRLVAIDTATCWGVSANPYSMKELRDLVTNPVTSISSVYTTNSDGDTTAITFVTNVGNITFSGEGIDDFRTIYMLRSPGYLMIPQNGFTHINIEKAG